MNNSRTFDDVWEEFKASGEKEKTFYETAEDTARVINELAEERIQRGISQRQLAELCGLKQSAIARMESLQSIPRIDTLIRVANALNLKVELAKDSITSSKIIDFYTYRDQPQIGSNNYVYNPCTSLAVLTIS